MSITRLSDVHNFFRREKLLCFENDIYFQLTVDSPVPPLGISKISYHKKDTYYRVSSWPFRGQKGLFDVNNEHEFYETIADYMTTYKLER